MNIRFTSSMTPEHENVIAPALIRAIVPLLNLLPIAYMIRIDTSDANIYEHVSPKPERAGSIGEEQYNGSTVRSIVRDSTLRSR